MMGLFESKKWLVAALGLVLTAGCSSQQQANDDLEASQQSGDDDGYDYDNQESEQGSLENDQGSLDNQYSDNQYSNSDSGGNYGNDTADINSDLANDTQGTDLLDNQMANSGNYGTNSVANMPANTGNFGTDLAPPVQNTSGFGNVAAGGGPAYAPPPAGGSTPIAGGRVRYVPAGGVQVSSSPGGGSVVATLEQGEHPITWEENGWLRISDGWYVPMGSMSDQGIGRPGSSF